VFYLTHIIRTQAWLSCYVTVMSVRGASLGPSVEIRIATCLSVRGRPTAGIAHDTGDRRRRGLSTKWARATTVNPFCGDLQRTSAPFGDSLFGPSVIGLTEVARLEWASAVNLFDRNRHVCRHFPNGRNACQYAPHTHVKSTGSWR